MDILNRMCDAQDPAYVEWLRLAGIERKLAARLAVTRERLRQVEADITSAETDVRRFTQHLEDTIAVHDGDGSFEIRAYISYVRGLISDITAGLVLHREQCTKFRTIYTADEKRHGDIAKQMEGQSNAILADYKQRVAAATVDAADMIDSEAKRRRRG